MDQTEFNKEVLSLLNEIIDHLDVGTMTHMELKNKLLSIERKLN